MTSNSIHKEAQQLSNIHTGDLLKDANSPTSINISFLLSQLLCTLKKQSSPHHPQKSTPMLSVTNRSTVNTAPVSLLRKIQYLRWKLSHEASDAEASVCPRTYEIGGLRSSKS